MFHETAPVIVRVKDPSLAQSLAMLDIASATELQTIEITDLPGLAQYSSRPVVYIGLYLPNVLRALIAEDIRGLLKPDDATQPILTSVLTGARVYSRFNASELGVSESEYRLIRALACGASQADAAWAAGYSERQARRITRRLEEQATVERRYCWPLLAPVIG